MKSQDVHARIQTLLDKHVKDNVLTIYVQLDPLVDIEEIKHRYLDSWKVFVKRFPLERFGSLSNKSIYEMRFTRR